jgi:hypothetical protein
MMQSAHPTNSGTQFLYGLDFLLFPGNKGIVFRYCLGPRANLLRKSRIAERSSFNVLADFIFMRITNFFSAIPHPCGTLPAAAPIHPFDRPFPYSANRIALEIYCGTRSNPVL